VSDPVWSAPHLASTYHPTSHPGTIQRNQVIYQTCTVIFHYNESDCKQLDVKNASAEINVGLEL